MDRVPQSVSLILVVWVSLLNSSYSHYDPIPVNEFKCSQTGYYSHPENHHRLYECLQDPANPSRLISYTYECGDKECFDNQHEHKCSLEACSRNNNATGVDSEEFSCLRELLQQDAQKQCEEETLAVLEKRFPTVLQFTAHRGNAAENLRLSLRDVNLEMRAHYGRLIENTGKNAFPLMVATDSEPDYFGVGGVYKVYLRDGTMKRIVPIRPTYEIHKSLAHVALGVFSIISPYFLSPRSRNWQPALRNYQGTLRNVEYLLKNEDTGITGDELRLALTMLERTIIYIDTAINTNSVDMAEYKRFANGLAPFIEKSMDRAVRAHADDIIPALQKLKEEIGDDEWRRLYVIIPTVWPMSLFNVRVQVLEKMMSFKQFKNQVLIVEGAQTEQDAKTTLGRIVADRAIAQLVWGGLEEETYRDHIFSISTRRDLLSTPEVRELNRVCRELEEDPSRPNCPFAGRDGGTSGDGGSAQPPDMLATMLRGARTP